MVYSDKRKAWGKATGGRLEGRFCGTVGAGAVWIFSFRTVENANEEFGKIGGC